MPRTTPRKNRVLKRKPHTPRSIRHTLRKRRQVRKNRRFMVIGRIFLVNTFIFIFFILLSSTYVLAYLQDRNQKIPTPDKVFPEVGLATEIYDRNGVRLYRLFDDTSNSDKVNIGEISNVVKAVFMAAEDSEFYNHNGVDTNAMGRCLVLIANNDGFCGGSTITQQLIKITTNQNERSFKTKIDEILLALKVEQEFSKDQIMEMYLRVTPYGSNITGLKTAAKFYFGVTDLTQLTLAQSAILASIINSPANLSPTMSLDNETAQVNLKERQLYVLEQLSQKLDSLNQQLQKNSPGSLTITPEMIDAAKTEKLAYQPPIITDIKAGHFVNYVINKLLERGYNNGEAFTLQDLRSGGYKVYTSLDYNAQQIAERYVWDSGNQNKWLNMHNSAVMTIVPSTGEIVTMAGSKSFYASSEECEDGGVSCKFDPQVNIFTTLQSPGSTNKPIGYYAAFRDRVLYPWSYLSDVPTRFGDYEPKNWDGLYLWNQAVTARDMLRLSRNIPAVKVITKIGVENYLNTARSFGYTTYQDSSNYGPSVILGGADIYLDEHIQAYGVFANGGDLVKIDPILRIEDSNGNVIYSANPQRIPVADWYGVSTLNQTLYRLDTLAAPIYWDERDIAGKTGTTEDNKDVLLILYSPDFVTLAWGGNNDNDPINQYLGWPGYLLSPWVRSYMWELGMNGWFNQKTRFSW